MGQPLRDETYLSRVARDPSSGRHHHEVGIRCRRCAHEEWATAPQPGWGRRIFKKKGWKCGNSGNAHICPTCFAGRRASRGAALHQLFDPPPCPDIPGVGSCVVLQTPPMSPLVEFPELPPPTTHAMEEESMASSALAEALQPLKAKQERSRIVKGSRGKPTGFNTAESAQNSARVVCRKLGVERPVRDTHYRLIEEPDKTWSYVLLGTLEDQAPNGPAPMLRVKEGVKTSNRQAAERNAEIACKRAGIAVPIEDIHYEVSGSHRDGGYLYRLLPATKLDADVAPMRLCGGGYLSRFDARKSALSALQAARKTGGAPAEDVDYWITQDGYNLWGWTTTKPQAPSSTAANEPAVEEYLTLTPATEDPMPADPPRKPSTAENRWIMEALDEHYDVARQRYRLGISDHMLADQLDLPRAWVSRVREEFYGPEINEAEDEQRRAQRAKVEAAIGVAEQALGKGQTVIDVMAELETAVVQLKAVLADLRK